MFRSLFGRGKKRKRGGGEARDDSIRSARVGDVVLIPGMWETGEDAYLIVERVNRLKSAFGESRELETADGERRASVEWSEDEDGLHVAVTRQDRAIGLSALGLDYDTLVAWDDFKSIENSVEYGGRVYHYRNSYETLYYKGHDPDGRANDDYDDWEGFYVWEFAREDDGGSLTVVKWEGKPFEAYVSVAVPAHLVAVYHK